MLNFDEVYSKVKLQRSECETALAEYIAKHKKTFSFNEGVYLCLKGYCISKVGDKPDKFVHMYQGELYFEDTTKITPRIQEELESQDVKWQLYAYPHEVDQLVLEMIHNDPCAESYASALTIAELPCNDGSVITMDRLSKALVKLDKYEEIKGYSDDKDFLLCEIHLFQSALNYVMDSLKRGN